MGVVKIRMQFLVSHQQALIAFNNQSQEASVDYYFEAISLSVVVMKKKQVLDGIAVTFLPDKCISVFTLNKLPDALRI